MDIRDLQRHDEALIQQVATVLMEGFASNWPAAWSTQATALAEVYESFTADHISRVALDEAGTVLGWIGANLQYDGKVWELHPLVVRVSHQGQGIGRALVTDLEACVRERGGLTILLGSDDENDQTTLGGIDLFPDVLAHLAHIKNLKRHPYEFYQKLGYAIVGVIPDANGMGKPDILLAKSVAR